MTLASYVETQASWYRNVWRCEKDEPERKELSFNQLIADRLDELAYQIRLTGAEDVATFRDRWEAMNLERERKLVRVEELQKALADDAYFDDFLHGKRHV